ncbi:hypothetical protein CEXT_271171 [Caerostris extrusa]|uniref:Uncharacterized protein n=1 Tax=Caerostris extrusa TaxID=172846 RepID=A0AAV4Y1Q7_CAEEX|nr:hypothetical protein CEXT_271171 [Caerostris extrusa]
MQLPSFSIVRTQSWALWQALIVCLGPPENSFVTGIWDDGGIRAQLPRGGGQANCVSGFSLTEENYDTCLKLLKDRKGCKD